MALHKKIFYLLIVCLPIQLGYHWWPSWSIVLGRRIDYLSPTLYFTDVLIILVLIFWIIEGKIHVHSIYRYFYYQKRILFFLCIVICFASINIFSAKNPYTAIWYWIKIFEFSMLGFYIRTTSPSLLIVKRGFIFSMIIVSIIGIVQVVFGHAIGGIFWFLGERMFRIDTPGIATVTVCLPYIQCKEYLRAYSTFPHPNMFGMYTAAALVLFQHGIWLNRLNTKKYLQIILYFVVYGILFTGLILSFSRSAISSYIVGSFLLWMATSFYIQTRKIQNITGSTIQNDHSCFKYMSFGRRRHSPPASGLCLFSHTLSKHVSVKFFYVYISILFLACTSILLFTIRPFSLSDESIQVRTMLTSASAQMYWDHPIVGVGAGNFISEIAVSSIRKTVYYLQPVHSIWLLILSETGSIGMLLVGILGISWVTYIYRIFTMSHTRSNELLPWIIIFILLLIAGTVDHYPLTLQQGMLLLFVSFGITLIKI